MDETGKRILKAVLDPRVSPRQAVRIAMKHTGADKKRGEAIIKGMEAAYRPSTPEEAGLSVEGEFPSNTGEKGEKVLVTMWKTTFHHRGHDYEILYPIIDDAIRTGASLNPDKMEVVG